MIKKFVKHLVDGIIHCIVELILRMGVNLIIKVCKNHNFTLVRPIGFQI